MEVCQTANKHLIRSAKERREKRKKERGGLLSAPSWPCPASASADVPVAVSP